MIDVTMIIWITFITSNANCVRREVKNRFALLFFFIAHIILRALYLLVAMYFIRS